MEVNKTIKAFEKLLQGYINLAADFGINNRDWPTVKDAKKALDELKKKNN
jgi:hypothetical protein